MYTIQTNQLSHTLISCRISQPIISYCYEELIADLSLLQSFLENEWISIHGLPHLCTIHLHVVSERLFSQVISSALWGKAEANFLTKVGKRATSIETAHLAILVTDRVMEGKLGLITAFCRTYQSLDTLSTLVQRESPMLGVVVVKVFTNSHHLLWASFGFPYLDITTLSVDTFTRQSPLAQMHSCRLLPYSLMLIVLPWEKEGDGLKCTQLSWRHCRRVQKRSIICPPFVTGSTHCLLPFQ